MTEVSQTHGQAKIRWLPSLITAAIPTIILIMAEGGIPQWGTLAATVLLVVSPVSFGVVIVSQRYLDGPEVWVFDDEGYRYARQSRLWPTQRRIAYADIARIQVTRRAGRPESYALILGLRSGKTVRIGTYWDEAQLAAIRNLLAQRLPGSDLPLPAE